MAKFVSNTHLHSVHSVRPIAHWVSEYTVHAPAIGEIIMVCLPPQVAGSGSLTSPSAISDAYRTNYHPYIVVRSTIGVTGWDLKIFIYLPLSSCPILSALSLVWSWRRESSLFRCHGFQLSTPCLSLVILSVPGYYPRYKTWVTTGTFKVNMGVNAPVNFFIPSLTCPCISSCPVV